MISSLVDRTQAPKPSAKKDIVLEVQRDNRDGNNLISRLVIKA